MGRPPSLFKFDQQWREREQVALLGGVDEAGRGALAGPVVSAVVVFAPEVRIRGVNDSKQLTAAEREAFVPKILERAAAWSVGWASAAEIDRINILQATLLAARRALDCLAVKPDFMLTDFLKIPEAPCPFKAIVDGDAQSQAVAAASVLAKVARDRIMQRLHEEYPVYNHFSHKGYGTPEHWAALNAYGVSTLHRLSYNGICFFDTPPPVRSIRRGRIESPFSAEVGLPSPDWLSVLSSRPDELDPRLFLPECECDCEMACGSAG